MDFSGVHRWTVDSIDESDFQTFCHWVPWNGVGIVNNLYVGGAANRSYELQHFRKFIMKTVPKNITIKNIGVGGREPCDFIRYIPVDYPVETISISAWSSEYGLDKLPEALQRKIVKR
jgi:hypothetical protein